MTRTPRLFLTAMLIAFSHATSGFADEPESKMADVNHVQIHYLISGKGTPIVLLHGYAETSRMWLPLMRELEKTHTVIAPDLRGAGGSSTPADGYTKAVMAQDIHALVASLGDKNVEIVGHDIGLMVAYAYAAQYPTEVSKIALMDAFLPGVGDWTHVWLMRDLWHFHFYGETPLALVKGRERIYLEHFWNEFAADRNHSVPEADRVFYAREYAKPEHMKAGFEYFKAFEQDAKEFGEFSKTPLTMPMLVLSGDDVRDVIAQAANWRCLIASPCGSDELLLRTRWRRTSKIPV